MKNRIMMYLSWLWPWKIVTWVYSENQVLVSGGRGYLWRVLVSACALSVLSVLISWTGVIEIKGDFNIYD